MKLVVLNSIRLVNKMSILIELFEAFVNLDEFRYAIIAGLILAFLAPLIGSVVVIRRLSFIADTLSHFSLAGVTFGVFFGQLINVGGISPTIIGVVFGVLGTFLIEKLRGFYKNYKELSMPIIMSLGVALSGIFISLSAGINSKYINGLLFGSIYNIRLIDLLYILIITAFILSFAAIAYKKIITLCFDETYAKVSGVNVKLIQTLITICLAFVISFFLNLIGVLLISALMIIPISIGILVGKSYVHTLKVSIIFSELSTLLGFLLSFLFDLPTGSTIILTNIFFLFAIIIYKSIKNKFIIKDFNKETK